MKKFFSIWIQHLLLIFLILLILICDLATIITIDAIENSGRLFMGSETFNINYEFIKSLIFNFFTCIVIIFIIKYGLKPTNYKNSFFKIILVLLSSYILFHPYTIATDFDILYILSTVVIVLKIVIGVILFREYKKN